MVTTAGAGALPIGYLPIGVLPTGHLPTGAVWTTGCGRGRSAATAVPTKANECFVTIATTILSMEILASSFAGWSSLYPEAANNARAFLRRNSVNAQTLLMDYYVYRSKHSNIFAKLSPPSP